jgi:taurine dioxygenase
MAPWMAFGVQGDETPEGDALFEEVWDAAKRVMKDYTHTWKGTEMVAWDNARMLHRGLGSSPDELRVMHRTTIRGDYGKGRWEEGGDLAKRPEKVAAG